MSDDMNTKYQQHYNKILSGTLADTILKSISFQANINLANEIIAEQEKTIEQLEEVGGKIKEELETVKSNKTNSENTKIKTLEETNTRLSAELGAAMRMKSDYESVKTQAGNVETFRNQLVKEREAHQKTKDDYELQINELKQRIENLEAPPKKKRTVKSVPTEETVVETNQTVPTEDTVKDGGSF